MRKYFIAGAVALMVFAIVAFAASLAVDGGVLQAGTADDLTVVDSAEVLYQTNASSNPPKIWLDAVTVKFDSTDADGMWCYVILWSNGAWMGLGYVEIEDDTAVLPVNDGEVNVEDVSQTSVMVKNSSDWLVDGQDSPWGGGVFSNLHPGEGSARPTE